MKTTLVQQNENDFSIKMWLSVKEQYSIENCGLSVEEQGSVFMSGLNVEEQYSVTKV